VIQTLGDKSVAEDEKEIAVFMWNGKRNCIP